VPISFSIDENIGLITLTVSRQVTAADITDYMAASRSDPAYCPTMHRLLVASGVEKFPQLPEVREITTRTHAGSPDPATRIAAVADTPLGLAMISMFLGHWRLSDRYRLFDDVPSAMAWLASETAPAT
jgi:hypothetical protein